MVSLLLEKTRMLNKRIQQGSSETSVVNFDLMSDILSEMINCNTYILDESGKLLGYHFIDGFDCGVVENLISQNKRMPNSYNEDLIEATETISNLVNETQKCVFATQACDFGNKYTTIIPIFAGKYRQGTLMIAKFNSAFVDEDLILAEYGASLLGIEMFRARSEEEAENIRERDSVKVALGTLSYSELEAAEHIFQELDGDEGLLVASKIADRVGITRSVIVNALRKFESAGVIESKSLGMKGTYIRVLNKFLLEAINKD